MAKYKILLTGEYRAAVDDLFSQNADALECMTTSGRIPDMEAHLRYFSPSLFMYFMSDEQIENMKNVATFAAALRKQNIPIGLYGTENEIRTMKGHMMDAPDLVFIRPKSMNAIKEGILDFLDDAKISGLSDEKLASVTSSISRVSPAAGVRPGVAPAPAPAHGMDASGDNRKHILVIDDDPMMLKLIREYLRADYQVATAINGRTAHKFLETRSTDLILLDYEMPGDNGPTVLKQLRENPNTASIPVIFLTGITERDKIQEALSHKPQGYMLKPVDHDKLMQAVRKFV